MKDNFLIKVATQVALVFTVAAILTACASGPEKPKPAELLPSAALMGVHLAWSAKIGAINFAGEAELKITRPVQFITYESTRKEADWKIIFELLIHVSECSRVV